MANGNKISCKQYTDFLINQAPVYDKEILRDVRPLNSEMIGFFKTMPWDAYDEVNHTFDRLHSTMPNTTKVWREKETGSCVADAPCDPTANKIGWGNTRETYGRDIQSWETAVQCFDEIMTKTKAVETWRHIIEKILRPATNWIMSAYLARRAGELAGKKWCVTTGMPEFTFSWTGDTDNPDDYIYLITDAEPTGRITPEILRSRTMAQYAVGAITEENNGFNSLLFNTDIDTFHYLSKQDPILLDAWRFGEFGPAAKEFFRYGLRGYVGEFMVKCLLFPPRFNKVTSTKYQVVLPYKNVPATNGIKDVYNEDYDKAQYQWSYINHSSALTVRPFKAEAVNEMMPFMIRDYGGKWRFGTNDLGADCNGKPIDNVRGNKGKFFADFDIGIRPDHPEWLELFFSMRDRPCITIVPVCNTSNGYPAQNYDSANDPCESVFEFTAVKKSSNSHYTISANTIIVDGNVLTHSAIDTTTLAALVAALPAVLGGEWAIGDADLQTITLTGSTADSVDLPFLL